MMARGTYDPTKTGNSYIDPLLSGWKWNGSAVSYGFAQSAAVYGNPIFYHNQYPSYHFQPLSERSVAAYQGILTGQASLAGSSMVLTPVAGFTNLNLVQTDPAVSQTDMRFGMSSIAPYAIGFAPGEYALRGGADGDVWIGNSGAYGAAFQLQNPVSGSWGYYTHLWALGKALGLNSGYMSIPKDKQFKEYTLMTYYDAPSVELPALEPSIAGLAGSQPEFENLSYYTSQTFMMLDIAALQQMYGANYNFRNEDTTYSWSPTNGAVFVNGILSGVVGDGLATSSAANKIFQTLWDGGGIDTYDLSTYTTDLKLDLTPGEYSIFSDDQRMYIGRDIYDETYFARGNVYNALLFNGDPRSLIENAKGGSGHDTLTGNSAANHLWGNAGKDTFEGAAGDDILEGGEGEDVALFSGTLADYIVQRNSDGSVTITDTRQNCDGSDTLIGIDYAQFTDQLLRLTNSLPTNLRLAGSTSGVAVVEGTTTIGTLTAEDGDGDTITWSFDETAIGGGSADGLFVLQGGQIVLAPDHALEYDGANAVHSYTLHVKASDGNGGETKQSFTVTVTNDPSDDPSNNPHAPENLRLAGSTSGVSVVEGTTTIGALTAEDGDGDAITWSFDETSTGGGNANGLFVIENGTLKLAAGKALDFETGAHSYTVQVKASDGHGGVTSKSFTIGVSDALETMRGSNGSNSLRGGIGADKIYGYGGNDALYGGLGNDILLGGSGSDKFVFNTALNGRTNVDMLADFNARYDTIRLENAIFGKLKATGALKSAYFTTGSKAAERDDYIVYNKKAGILSYDADGSGKGAAVAFAKVKPGAALTHADIFII